MSRIHILSSSLADKIAAGEVVERPASVVKELIENALDAGARHIRIDILKAGRELIQVSDDAFGMTEEEAALAFKRHATSKIASEDDLFNIATLGFRGEALPSIAAVSHVIMETKPRGPDVLEGTHLELKGGEVLPARAAGCPVGTQMRVADLFYNTPARLKFLKSDGVELGHIENVVLSLALSRFDCGFEFFAEGKQKLLCVANENPFARLKNCLGNLFVEDAIEVFEPSPDFKLSGWILHPRQSAGNANGIYTFLNGRLIKDRLITHALMSGFGDFLMKGRTPKAVLYLKVPAQEVDVNVHPAKREVRFRQLNLVHQFVEKAVKKVLQKKIYGEGRVQDLGEGASEEASKRRHSFWGGPQNGVSSLGPPKDNIPRKEWRASDTLFSASSLAPSLISCSSLRIIGTLADTYILCESPDSKLILIDQHAAHEAIGFKKLKKSFEENRVAAQRLLVPFNWEANPTQAAVLNQHLSELAKIGLEMEPFGGNTFVVKAIPSLLETSKIIPMLEKLVEELESVGTSQEVQKTIDLVLKTVACHAQVRAGDKLAREELQFLIQEMDEYQATHCPHGRPTSVEISKAEIEKWFRRV